MLLLLDPSIHHYASKYYEPPLPSFSSSRVLLLARLITYYIRGKILPIALYTATSANWTLAQYWELSLLALHVIRRENKSVSISLSRNKHTSSTYRRALVLVLIRSPSNNRDSLYTCQASLQNLLLLLHYYYYYYYYYY
jgi:hypothetical protein